MSSSTLATIETQLKLYAYPVFMILGSIGNIFILIIFSRQRQSACSIYLITSAIINILYLLTTAFLVIFPLYDNGTINAIIFCKISSYIPIVIGQVTKTMLVFACIDRYMITSNQARFRAFRTPKRAKYLIVFSIFFWVITAIHIPIMSIIVNGQCTQVGIYATIFTFYSILFIGLIPSITLIVFGYLTYHNMRQLRNRIQPMAQDMTNMNKSIQRRDRDLLIIVISEVFVYVITTSLFPLIQLEMLITQYTMPNKTFQYLQAEIFTLNISLLLLFIFSAAPFYTYLISSKSFRRDFKQLIINTYWKLKSQTAVAGIHSRTDRALAQQESRV